MHACAHAHIRTYIHAYIYAHVHTCKNVHSYTRIYIHMQVYTWTHRVTPFSGYLCLSYPLDNIKFSSLNKSTFEIISTCFYFVGQMRPFVCFTGAATLVYLLFINSVRHTFVSQWSHEVSFTGPKFVWRYQTAAMQFANIKTS